MTSWFLSDIHLKSLEERNGQILLRFLRLLNENPKENRVFLLGDIFDFWLSNGKAFYNHYKELVDEMERFKKNGGEICYFEGNHDFHVDVFWTKKFDIPVFENENYFNVEGKIIRCEHGDFINPDDIAYLKYRATIRHPYLEPVGHIVPGFFWKWFGEKMSQKSRSKSSYQARLNPEKMQAMIRAYALRCYQEKPFDLIVTGHMHVHDDYTFDVKGKSVRSINLGSWLEKPCALKLQNNQISMVELSL